MSERKDALTFPCQLSIKAVGYWAEDFEEYVLALMRRHAAAAEPEPSRSRPSRSGRYLAVTLRVTLESREQMDALYDVLGEDQRIRWAL